MGKLIKLMDYKQIITFFLTTSVITTAIVYLAKLIIDKFAESRLENYKNSLEQKAENFRHELNLETEKFRHDLNTTLIEHQIKYTKLYEERGQVIKLLYNSLLDLETALLNLTTLWQGPEWTTDTERDKVATETIKNLRIHLEQNRIFFSEELCNKIESILTDSHKITVEMYIAKKNEQRNQSYNKTGIELTEKELLSPSNTWHKLDKKVQQDLKLAKLDVAQEFRILIGVTGIIGSHLMSKGMGKS